MILLKSLIWRRLLYFGREDANETGHFYTKLRGPLSFGLPATLVGQILDFLWNMRQTARLNQHRSPHQLDQEYVPVTGDPRQTDLASVVLDIREKVAAIELFVAQIHGVASMQYAMLIRPKSLWYQTSLEMIPRERVK